MTVSEGLREEYLKLYPSLNTSVIRNIPPSFKENRSSNVDYRKKLGLNQVKNIDSFKQPILQGFYFGFFLLNNIAQFKEDWRILFLIKNSDRHRIINHKLYQQVPRIKYYFMILFPI